MSEQTRTTWVFSIAASYVLILAAGAVIARVAVACELAMRPIGAHATVQAGALVAVIVVSAQLA